MTYPTAPPQVAFGAPLGKPTDVMGRRIGALLLNIVIGAVVTFGLFVAIYAVASPGKRYTNVQAQTGHDAEYVCDHYDPQDRNNKICIATEDDELVLLDGGPLIVITLAVSVGWWILNYVILEGVAGGSVGKLIVGLRVIREDGSKAGLGWALLRNVLLIIPDMVLVGLVGLIVSLTNDDHQRVGDLAASTFVVDKHAAGRPLRSAPPGFGGYGAPGQGVYTQGTFGPPGQVAGPAADAQPDAAASAYQPQWDQARNTYIWWNADQQQWLEHDRASGEWRPISQ